MSSLFVPSRLADKAAVTGAIPDPGCAGMGRLGAFEAAADAVLDLSAPGAAVVTGQGLPVKGGFAHR